MYKSWNQHPEPKHHNSGESIYLQACITVRFGVELYTPNLLVQNSPFILNNIMQDISSLCNFEPRPAPLGSLPCEM